MDITSFLQGCFFGFLMGMLCLTYIHDQTEREKMQTRNHRLHEEVLSLSKMVDRLKQRRLRDGADSKKREA